MVSLGVVLLLAACAQGPVVLRAIDGDTLEVQMEDGAVEIVRIIGIDTPESVHPRKPVECFALEAKNKLQKLVEGKTVQLTEGRTTKDRYGRLLRYVYVNGQDVGEKMISGGYAMSYRKYPHPHRETYNKLEEEARGAKMGLWGDACQ
jgi:micrococcal nuclease